MKTDTKSARQQHRMDRDHGYILLKLRGRKWHTEIKINGVPGYIRKATDCVDMPNAWVFAQTLYQESVEQYKSTGSVAAKSFNATYKEWIETRRGEGADEKKLANFVECIDRYAGKYWKNNKSVSLITDADILAFISWRKTQSTKPVRDVTIKRDLVPVKLLFDFALEKKYIKRQLTFPKYKEKSETRAHFTADEWDRIVQLLPKWVDHAKLNCKNAVRSRIYLRYYVLLVGLSGLRPGTETQHVKWSDFATVEDNSGNNLPIVYVSDLGKNREKGKRAAIMGYAAKMNMLKLKNFRKAECSKIGKPFSDEEYVFCHKDGQPILDFKKGFRTFLEYYGLLLSKDERKVRSLYSLRHTYGTIFSGNPQIATSELADQMGTSERMINSHYNHRTFRDYGTNIMDVKMPILDRSKKSKK